MEQIKKLNIEEINKRLEEIDKEVQLLLNEHFKLTQELEKKFVNDIKKNILSS